MFLAACALAPPGRYAVPGAVPNYAFDGRFSLRHGGEIHSGRLSWQHSAALDRVVVADPFGNGVAELEHAPSMTQIRLADGTRRADVDGDRLMLQLVGVPLPLAGIGAWLTGRVAADAVATRDHFGRVIGLARDGWTITFGYAEDDVDALPARVVVARPEGPELRLAIERWDLGR